MFSTAVDELQQRCASRTAPLAAAAASASALDSRARLEVWWSVAGDSGRSRDDGVSSPPGSSTASRHRPRPASSSSLHEVVQSAAPCARGASAAASGGAVHIVERVRAHGGQQRVKRGRPRSSQASGAGELPVRILASSTTITPRPRTATRCARLILDLASISIDLARSRHNIPFALSISLVIQEAALARLGLAVGWRLA